MDVAAPMWFESHRILHVWAAFVLEVSGCAAIMCGVAYVPLVPGAVYPPAISDSLASCTGLSIGFALGCIAFWAERTAYELLVKPRPSCDSKVSSLYIVRLACVQGLGICLLLLSVIDNIQTNAAHNVAASMLFATHVVLEGASITQRALVPQPDAKLTRAAWLVLESALLVAFVVFGTCFGLGESKLGCATGARWSPVAEYLQFALICSVPAFRVLDPVVVSMPVDARGGMYVA